jgi:transposase
MPKPGLKKINRYTETFKATAVKLAHLKGVLKQDVAESLDIHPFMLSRWIKEVREGKIVAKGKKVELDTETVTELKRLKKLEKEHERLKLEHALLKKPSGSVPNKSRNLPLHRAEPGKLAGQNDV